MNFDVVLLIVAAVMITFAVVSNIKKKKVRLPVCNCYANGKDVRNLKSSFKHCYTDKSISFHICQCRVCGGVTGHPVSEFNYFMDTAKAEDISRLMDRFYETMRNPA